MVNEEITDLFTKRCYAEEVSMGESYLEAVKTRMSNALANAPEMWTGVVTYEPGTPVAWIMWNGGAGTYSVGDAFNPADNTDGITAGVAIVDGAGEYTVSLDFRDGNDGLTFAALAIADGERLYPGSIINITEILVDGEPIELVADSFTTSDDGLCTRVNLYNSWVNRIPEDARSSSGDLTKASAVILDHTKLIGIHSIKINFSLITN